MPFFCDTRSENTVAHMPHEARDFELSHEELLFGVLTSFARKCTPGRGAAQLPDKHQVTCWLLVHGEDNMCKKENAKRRANRVPRHGIDL